MIGEKQGKVWGITSQIFQKNNVEIQKLKINKNSKSSLHMHKHRYNMFYVLDGIIKINIHKNNYNLIDSVILKRDEYTIVQPEEYHEFVSLCDDCELLEIYWTDYSSEDIVRKNCGSKLNAEK
jgi:mannose-6-phosphate isomerase-like protein (cupin superfamily)